MKDLEVVRRYLGYRVTDVITGFAGVVTSVSFDVAGCVQAIVQPVVDKDGKPNDGRWFDVIRLNVGELVIGSPLFADSDGVRTFGDVGATSKPSPETKPVSK